MKTRTLQLGLVGLGQSDLVLVPSAPKVKVVKRLAAPPEPKGLIWLFSQRSGTPKLWGRFVFSLFHFDPGDFPRGKYRAALCSCSMLVGVHGIDPSPCREHPGLSGACFSQTAEMGETGRAWAAAQSWYGKLPWAHLASDGFGSLRSLALRPVEVGIGKARDLGGKIITIDEEFNGCGCPFLVKRFDIPGIPWKCRTGHMWLLVKQGSCGNAEGRCVRVNLPQDSKAVVAINRAIKANLINY